MIAEAEEAGDNRRTSFLVHAVAPMPGYAQGYDQLRNEKEGAHSAEGYIYCIAAGPRDLTVPLSSGRDLRDLTTGRQTLYVQSYPVMQSMEGSVRIMQAAAVIVRQAVQR